MPSNPTYLSQILNKASSEHMEMFLMPLNSTDFNHILNTCRTLTLYGDHPKHHQLHQPQSGTAKSSSTPARPLEMSLIFEGVLDAFKLNRFQPKF